MRQLLATLLVPAVLAACAAAEPGYTPPPAKPGKMHFVAPTGGGFQADGTYELNDKEKELNCKQLTGSIQIRIEQLRLHASRPRPSDSAVAIQQATRPFVHGSGRGSDMDADYARDKAQVEAYNRALKAKGCKSFDVEAELKASPQRGAPSARPR